MPQRTTQFVGRSFGFETPSTLGWREGRRSHYGLDVLGFESSLNRCLTAEPSLEIPRGEIHSWLVPLTAPAEWVESFSHFLSSDEQQRAARFSFPEGRRRYTLARGVLRYLLGRYLHRDPAGLSFAYNSFGKPSLSGLPAESTLPPLDFNLSHSHDLALYAFAREGALGVDLERQRAEVLGERLADRFFSPEEAHELAALEPSQQLRGFFDCWTRKEAYIKARGDGLSRSLSSFAVSLRPDEPPSLRWCHDDPEASRRWRIWPIRVPLEFVACVVAPSTATRLREFEFREGSQSSELAS